MAICSVKQSAGGANLNAVSALRAVEPSHVSADDGMSTSSTGLDRIFSHPFVANSRAALTEDAALWFVRHHRRKVAFCRVVLFLGKAFFQATPIEGHLLEFTFTTAIAD